jgi:Pentapeptide repeats (8 copies)
LKIKIEERATHSDPHQEADMAKATLYQRMLEISPIVSSIGIMLIPIVLWWGGQHQITRDQQAQEIHQQNAIKDYLAQMTTFITQGNLRADKDLQLVARAATLNLLPTLSGRRKAQVIYLLVEMQLVQETPLPSTPLLNRQAPNPPIIPLVTADLEGAELSFINLSRTNLSHAKLSYAQLRYANLEGAQFNQANFYHADLTGASLLGADLKRSYLLHADLSDVTNLTQEQLEGAAICRTKLPSYIYLDPNRDCRGFNINP